MKKWTFLVISFLFLNALPAYSQQWQLDVDHSSFYFSIKHTYATIRGEFTDFNGDVNFDPAEPEKSSFNFTIKTESVDTSIEKRDTHLRSEEFFDVGKYPLMTFKSTKVTKEGDDLFRFDGVLTIKDVSKNVSLVFKYYGQQDNKLAPGKIVAGLDATLTLDRLEYHVGTGKFYEMGVLGKEVEIMATLELLRDK